jgi:hypothetical protein
MVGVRRSSAFVAAGAAWVGLVAGHVVAYAVAYPSGAVRHAHLLLTGHGWMGPALLSLAATIPAVIAAAAVRTARAGPVATGPTAIRLAAVQVPAFLLVEMAERHDLGAALADPAVLAGLALQVVIAGALALLLAGFTRAVALVVSRRSAISGQVRPLSDVLPALEIPPASPHFGQARVRAPPSFVSA